MDALMVLSCAVAALSLAVALLAALLVQTRRRLARRERQEQTDQDLFQENVVRAIVELVLRQDALVDEVRRVCGGGDADGAGGEGENA